MKRYLCALGAPWAEAVYVPLWAATRGVWASVLPTDDFSDRLARAGTPRYVFFLNWSAKVPASIVEQYECVNFHCTALPYGRGGHPIENLILAGHTKTVITAHRMTSEIDAGPIYGTRGPVGLAGTKDEICARFVSPVAELMRWIVETEPTPTPQPEHSTLFHRLTPEAYRQFWEARGACQR